MKPEPQFFELFVPAQRGLPAEVLKFNLHDQRDLQLYRTIVKACTQPWNPLDNLGDWLEDQVHENGQYLNACLHCHRYFKGHKRRVFCKECAHKPKS